MKTVKTSSPAQTYQLGRRLAKQLRGGEVLALYGALGTGKTQFIKGLAKGLGINRTVTSPTFVIGKFYPFKKNHKKFYFCHFDLYRVQSAAGLALAGLTERLQNRGLVVAIEWPEVASRLLPKKTLKFFFSHGKKIQERTIKSSSRKL